MLLRPPGRVADMSVDVRQLPMDDAGQAPVRARPPVIAMRHISKVYGQGDIAVHALRALSLTIERGDYVAIMGASGKSTHRGIRPQRQHDHVDRCRMMLAPAHPGVAPAAPSTPDFRTLPAARRGPGTDTKGCDTERVRVLVVEDEVRLSSALKRGLEAEGFSVDVAANGSDGLWMATEQTYDVIMLDIMLPGINGLKICQTLRDKAIWTPVLVLTAKDGELDEAEALEIGADDFLSKPFSYTVLVARIRALLRRGTSPRPTMLTVAGIELDPATRVCRVDGQPVELTGREHAILEYLLRHKGEVVPKGDILGHVWDFAFEGGDNVVEVHISSLRRKVGATTIETIRGSGYRILDRRNAVKAASP